MMNQIEHSPCAGCHQRCCINYTVTITGYDAWLIATELQRDMREFVVYYPAQKDEPDNFRLDHGEMAFKIALGKGAANGEEQPCIFWLSLPEGYARCSIYPFRPFVCQSYPSFLNEGLVQLRTDVLCPQRSWNMSTMDLPAWRRRLLRYQMEYDIYAYVVERWNDFVARSPADVRYPINLYYSYLIAVYDRLHEMRQTISKAREESILQQWGSCIERRINPLKQLQQNRDQSFGPRWMEFVADLLATIDSASALELEMGTITECLDDMAKPAQEMSVA
jgi:Fe-S-cluster containining protein